MLQLLKRNIYKQMRIKKVTKIKIIHIENMT